MRIFAARIGHFDWRPVRLFDPGDDLAADRTIWVLGIDEIEKMRSNSQCQLISREDNSSAFFAGKGDLLFELLQVGNPIFKLPLPIVPKFGSDIGPESRGKRKEPLVSGFG
jgi:hypothetical protein